MKRALMLSLALVVMAGAATAGEWFDMENCAFCSKMAAKPGLMDSMHWESYNLSQGIVAITTVKPGHLDAYRTAHKEMMAAGEKMSQGEMMKMCGSCSWLGECFMAGVQPEYVETTTGDIWIMTSDDAEMVAKLQEWAQRNTDEIKKMMKGKHEGHDHGSHDGHDHG